jgi:hypothetical protein
VIEVSHGLVKRNSWAALTVLSGIAGNPKSLRHVFAASALRMGGSLPTVNRSLAAG